MQATGDLVAAPAELAAGVQHGEHHLGRGEVVGTAWCVSTGMPRPSSRTSHPPSGSSATSMSCAVPGHGLVDGVVHDLVDQVVQPGRTGRADVHAGALAHRLEALEHLDRVGSVRWWLQRSTMPPVGVARDRRSRRWISGRPQCLWTTCGTSGDPRGHVGARSYHSYHPLGRDGRRSHPDAGLAAAAGPLTVGSGAPWAHLHGVTTSAAAAPRWRRSQVRAPSSGGAPPPRRRRTATTSVPWRRDSQRQCAASRRPMTWSQWSVQDARRVGAGQSRSRRCRLPSESPRPTGSRCPGNGSQPMARPYATARLDASSAVPARR